MPVTVYPSDATNKAVYWTSDDPSIASVNYSTGLVTAVSPGETRVWAHSYDGNKTDWARITVEGIPVNGVSLTPAQLTLNLGGMKTLQATISPSNAANKTLTWSCSDTSIVSVTSGGVVKGLKAGKAVVRVTSNNGKTATCQVTVVNQVVRVTGVTLSKTSASLAEGNSVKLIATILPSNATNKNVTWITSNAKVATVSGGTVKAVAPGTANITVKTQDGGKTAVCTVKVYLKNGWETVNGKKYYWKDGRKVTGWQTISGACYYFDPSTGVMQTGEKTIDRIPCYFDPSTGKAFDGWRTISGKDYWYEKGKRRGTKYDPAGVYFNGTNRGCEVVAPDANGNKAWFWLDSIYDGAKAVSKEVMMPYTYRGKDSTAKWVRYDQNGTMIKGWYEVYADGLRIPRSPTRLNELVEWGSDYAKGAKRYYYDPQTGAMVKGDRLIESTWYHFNENTGLGCSARTVVNGLPHAYDAFGKGLDKKWLTIDGGDYWYENGVRQGYDPKDRSYRGKEIYDPGTQGWYWLDNNAQGKKAVGKAVYQPYTIQGQDNIGKWVRYDEHGTMIKHWYLQNEEIYYFDPKSGAMYKGDRNIGGLEHRFNETTGVMELKVGSFATSDQHRIINRINDIRYEACVQGVENPETGQPLTLKDYRPVRWDNVMDCVTRIRAMEASYTIDHVRLDGTPCFDTMSVNEDSGYRAENLSWTYDGCMSGIELWYQEKPIWVRKGSGVTGHYESLIKPSYVRIGIACYRRNNARWPYTTAGSFRPDSR
jgi:uncharacterized protein YjdB